MAADLIAEVNRARVLLGLAPLTAAFHMSPEELAEKARNQTRNSEGQFVEEAEVKAQLPEDSAPVNSAQPAAEQPPAQAPAPEQLPAEVPAPEIPPIRLIPDVADEGTEPLPETDWQAAHKAARAKLPDDMSQFGMVEIDPNEVERGVTHRVDVAEVDGKPVPGPTVQAHLAAVLEIAAALDGELDRRITNRIRALTDEQLATIIGDAEARRDAAGAEKDRLEAELNEVREDARTQAMWQEWDRLTAAGEDMGELTEPSSVEEMMNSIHDYAPDSAEARAIKKLVSAALIGGGEDSHVRTKGDEFWAANKEYQRLSSSAEAASSGDVGPESLVYGLIQQQEAVGLIAEMREMGGEADLRVYVETASAHDTVSTALSAALGTLPSEWVEDIDSMGIEVGMTERGHFTQRGGINRVNLSSSDGNSLHAPLQGVAVHELSHAVEASRPHIGVMQWAMSHHRSPRDSEVMVQIYEPKEGDPPEMVFADQWWDAYSGKQYGAGTHQQHWEILTTGIESLMASSSYFRSKVAESGLDNEFRGFILALLADA